MTEEQTKLKPKESKPKLSFEQKLENLLEPIDVIGRKLTGSLWRDIYETLRDAICLNYFNSVKSTEYHQMVI